MIYNRKYAKTLKTCIYKRAGILNALILMLLLGFVVEDKKIRPTHKLRIYYEGAREMTI